MKLQTTQEKRASINWENEKQIMRIDSGALSAVLSGAAVKKT